MGYSAERHEILFDRELEGRGNHHSRGKELQHQAVGLYRTKRIVCGEYLELESFPVWVWQREATRAKRVKPTDAAQRAQNRKNAQKRLIRLMNTNFTEEDLFLTLTYNGDQPATMEAAKKDMQAYIRRVKRWRDKQGLPELRYIYTVECEGEGRRARVHHHIVMSGMDRDEAERLWGLGRANSSRLQPDEYGLEGLARYFCKTQGTRAPGERIYSCSRNLAKPHVTCSDQKLSRRAIARGVDNEAALRELIERREPDYIVNDITIRRSDIVAGAYVSVRMRRRPGAAVRRRNKTKDEGGHER